MAKIDNRRNVTRRLISTVKRMGCCQECGEKDGRKLTFHHKVPKNKRYEIADLPRNRPSVATVLTELEKCDLLCKTCHRFIHNGVVDG